MWNNRVVPVTVEGGRLQLHRGEVSDRQERVEAAFEHAFEQLIGSPKSPDQLSRYHRFRNHLLRMWGAFQEAQAEHDKAEREAAERFWSGLRLIRASRAQTAEGWSIVNAEEEREGKANEPETSPVQTSVPPEPLLTSTSGPSVS